MVTKKTTQNIQTGLYIHWPYCINKCPYCDFASTVCCHPNEEMLWTGYEKDIDFFKTDNPITSLFFGGGTPSLMSPQFLEKLLNKLSQTYSWAKEAEISMEVNPDTVDKNKLKAFKSLGINRLSIGVQSLNETALKMLGRTHSVQTALNCIQTAQTLFDNINIDLIYARPHQSLKSWEKELKTALALNLPHYSLYQLTIEEKTVFEKKGIKAASQLQARKLYQLTDTLMSEAQKPAYEVSNYAQKGFECRHNLTYWLGKDYIGIGPAAHGRLGLTATSNPRSVSLWIKENPQTETLTQQERDLEKLLMGLRLRTIPYPTQNLNETQIKKALQKNWIKITDKGILPTQEGTLMLNSLILLLAE